MIKVFAAVGEMVQEDPGKGTRQAGTGQNSDEETAKRKNVSIYVLRNEVNN